MYRKHYKEILDAISEENCFPDSCSGGGVYLREAILKKVPEITEEQLKNDYGWTDDMIEMRKTIYDLARQNPVFDFQDGVSAELSTLMQTVNQATMVTGGGATTWTECVAENQKAVDYIIKEANANVAE